MQPTVEVLADAWQAGEVGPFLELAELVEGGKPVMDTELHDRVLVEVARRHKAKWVARWDMAARAEGFRSWEHFLACAARMAPEVAGPMYLRIVGR